MFDCRVFQVPTRAEAVNCLIWRELDATRNSIQMAAQANFSHKQLHGKNCNELQEMLFQEKAINWNDYPSFFKRGTYIQRRKVVRAYTSSELDVLPLNHNAHKNPDLMVERTEIRSVDLPPLMKATNREAVVFDGADAITAIADTHLQTTQPAPPAHTSTPPDPAPR